MNVPALVLMAVALLGTATPVQAQRTPDRGYDYYAVCVLAEMVAGYVLPAADARLFRDHRLRRLPDTKDSSWFSENFTFSGDGVTGKVLRDRNTQEAFFQEFQVEARRIPPQLRSRQYLLGVLGVTRKPEEVQDFAAGCEQWSVSLHFVGDALVSARFGDARMSYD